MMQINQNSGNEKGPDIHADMFRQMLGEHMVKLLAFCYAKMERGKYNFTVSLQAAMRGAEGAIGLTGVPGAVGPPGSDGIKGQQGEQGDVVSINCKIKIMLDLGCVSCAEKGSCAE